MPLEITSGREELKYWQYLTMYLFPATTQSTPTTLDSGELSLREDSICNLSMLVTMMDLLEKAKMQRLSPESCTRTTSEWSLLYER